MKTLKQFYRELQAWIDAGCPEHEVFYAAVGICSNLDGWSGDNIDLAEQLAQSFLASKLDTVYPFNGGGGRNYNIEDCYKNPARLAWIKEHAA